MIKHSFNSIKFSFNSLYFNRRFNLLFDFHQCGQLFIDTPIRYKDRCWIWTVATDVTSFRTRCVTVSDAISCGFTHWRVMYTICHHRLCKKVHANLYRSTFQSMSFKLPYIGSKSIRSKPHLHIDLCLLAQPISSG